MANRCRHYPNQPCPLHNLQCQAPDCFEPVPSTKFVSKPQYVEAVQWTGDNWDAVREVLPGKVLLDFGIDFLPDTEPNTEGDSPNQLMVLAGKDGAQDWVPVPVGHWLVHPPGDLSDVWPVEDSYFQGKYNPAD